MSAVVVTTITYRRKSLVTILALVGLTFVMRALVDNQILSIRECFAASYDFTPEISKFSMNCIYMRFEAG